MVDNFGRKIEYMRVSITDRCDLRCRYCMPDGCEKVPMSHILTYEEILQICRNSMLKLKLSRQKCIPDGPSEQFGPMIPLCSEHTYAPGIAEHSGSVPAFRYFSIRSRRARISRYAVAEFVFLYVFPDRSNFIIV